MSAKISYMVQAILKMSNPAIRVTATARKAKGGYQGYFRLDLSQQGEILYSHAQDSHLFPTKEDAAMSAFVQGVVAAQEIITQVHKISCVYGKALDRHTVSIDIDLSRIVSPKEFNWRES